MLKFAQDFFKNGGGHFGGGFNSRVYGESLVDTIRGDTGEICAHRIQGWHEANEMIQTGKIFFKHSNAGVIKVYEDGNAWCCVGEGFKDLQESDNYVFADTRKDAIKKFIAQEATQ